MLDLQQEVGVLRASAEKSSTAAGATSLATGTCDTSSPSRPVIQCTGASKWVPVCSLVEMSFQYQAGPRSSNRLRSVSAKGAAFANGGGSWMIGVPLCRGAVRSTTSTRPVRSASSRSASTGMGAPRMIGSPSIARTVVSGKPPSCQVAA